VLQAQQENLVHKDRKVTLVLRDLLAHPGHLDKLALLVLQVSQVCEGSQVTTGHKVFRERSDRRDYLETPVHPVRLVHPDNRDRLGLLVSLDRKDGLETSAVRDLAGLRELSVELDRSV